MRHWPLAAGVAILAFSWLGPLPALARGSFAAHMLLHMAVVAIAPPLLALGLAGGRWDPARRAPRLFSPVPASLVELVAVWAWHAPALHHAARGGGAALVLEQATFFGAGLLLWIAAAGGDCERGRSRRAQGIVALLLTAMHMTLLGALLALAPRALYAHAGGGAGGLTPLEDQHLGGALMLLLGGASYLFGGLWLTRGLLSNGDGEDRRNSAVSEVGAELVSARCREQASCSPTPRGARELSRTDQGPCS